MNDNSRSPITDSRLLAAMLEVNPPIEKLMVDRLRLRHDNQETKAQLDEALVGMADLKQLRDVQLPRYIAKAKLASLSVAAMLLAALAFSLFSPLSDLTITATLFASMIFPLWLVDIAEQKFGRWKIRRGVSPVFVSKTHRVGCIGVKLRRGVQTLLPIAATACCKSHRTARRSRDPHSCSHLAALITGAVPTVVVRCGDDLPSDSKPDSVRMTMRTDVDHLPSHKQRELERVVQLIFEEFGDALGLSKHQWKKQGRIQKIILYGSYARGGWIDEPHTAKGYKSDYDLLIIVNDKRLTDRVEFWSKLDSRLIREYGITGTLKTPVNFIVHTLGEVNDGLAHGRYFFMDVARDGVALYQSDGTELHRPKPKTPHAALDMAKEYFEEWMPGASGMLETSRFSHQQGRLKDAAFLLHQSTERLYHCVLLVVTFYTPHVHNLGFLRTQAERLDRRLTYVWPGDNRKQRAMFEKLKEAYVKARYSRHYRISEEELTWLGDQVEELGRVVHTICTERIAQLETTAREAS